MINIAAIRDKTRGQAHYFRLGSIIPTGDYILTGIETPVGQRYPSLVRCGSELKCGLNGERQQ